MRKFTFGTKWNYIKLGIRFSAWGVNGGGTFPSVSGPNLWLGTSELGCGWMNNNLIGDYFGAGYGGGTWTATGSPAYYSTPANVYFYRKFGGSQYASVGPAVAGTSTGFATPYFSADPRYTRSVLYVILVKGSTNYTAYVQTGSSIAHGQVDWTRHAFQTGMGIGGNTVTNVTLSGAMNLNKTGSRELMDHANILHSRPLPAIEIWDFAVTRFY